MYSVKPENFKYVCLKYINEDFETEEVSEIKNKKIKNKKNEYVTFIVFSSSEVILSGKYTDNMRELYNFFRKIISENKEKLEEKFID